MKRAFWFLSFILLASTLGGFILAHEITWLLFQRGSFNTQDTINTAVVLQMYIIGLLPYGLQKLFLLWLYAKEMQLKAAKIATISLVTYIILAVSLITPMGVSGLALASTASGFVGFALTLQVFGVKNFFDILRSKNTIYISIGCVVFTILLLIFKGFISAYI